VVDVSVVIIFGKLVGLDGSVLIVIVGGRLIVVVGVLIVVVGSRLIVVVGVLIVVRGCLLSSSSGRRIGVEFADLRRQVATLTFSSISANNNRDKIVTIFNNLGINPPQGQQLSQLTVDNLLNMITTVTVDIQNIGTIPRDLDNFDTF
ncbi:6577_t:CDS:2, partial [Racocetra persica]